MAFASLVEVVKIPAKTDQGTYELNALIIKPVKNWTFRAPLVVIIMVSAADCARCKII